MPPPDLIEDVCAASAAYLVNVVLPAIVALPASEQFERVAACFEAALMAYRDGLADWIPEPSVN